MKSLLTVLFTLVLFFSGLSQPEQNACHPDSTYWSLGDDYDIFWEVSQENRLPHAGIFEMAGAGIQVEIDYQIDENKSLLLIRRLSFPSLLLERDSIALADQGQPDITINGIEFANAPITSVHIDGNITFVHQVTEGVLVTRTLFPSPSQQMLVEYWEIKNVGPDNCYLTFHQRPHCGDTLVGKKGVYSIEVTSDNRPDITLQTNEMYRFALYYTVKSDDKPMPIKDAEFTLMERIAFLQEIGSAALLITPDQAFNTAFELAKIKSAEKALVNGKGDTSLHADLKGVTILEGLLSNDVTVARKDLELYTCTYLLGSEASHFPSAELYNRFFTEGYFGISETEEYGVLRFKPSMPSSWKEMELQGFHAFGESLNIRLSKSRRYRGMYNFSIMREGIVILRKRIQAGRSVKVYVAGER